MSRPPLEVADLIRAAGAAFIERSRQWISWKHSQSAAGHRAVSHRRTRRASRSMHPLRASRHHLLQLLPKPALPEVSDCGPGTLDRGTPARTSPHALRPCGLHAACVSWHHWRCRTRRSSTICCSAPVPKPFWKSPAIPNISARRSASSACCTPGTRNSGCTRMSIASFLPAACRPIARHWIKSRDRFFLPVQVLRRVFRGKFVAGLKRAFQDGQLNFHGNLALLAQPKTFAAWLRPLFRKDWVVYAKPPFGGPEYVLQYLGRYTHRVAISNHRLVSFADGEGHVSLARLRSPQRTEVADPIAG